ncbi:leucine-rich repeat-containing protein 15-like [Chironomus tepperi]|uniref:leucine-rich repeat-containing protein 15-like n=1 Tax=Chironomus tepperi TaxID=113505 RepID=UPI00391FB6E4
MFFKILCIFALFGALNAQNSTLTCTYMRGWMQPYFCMLDIDNIEGSDDFTSILGDHVRGNNDSSVTVVYGSEAREGTAVNVPSRICEQFVKLVDLYLDGLHVKSIGDKEFSKCLNLETLYLGHNEISAVSVDAFKANSKLKLLDLGSNKITVLHGDVLKSLHNLESLYLDHNPFTQIDGQTFLPLINLHNLWLNSCGFTSLNPSWFNGLEELHVLLLNDNHLTRLPSEIFSSLRSLQVLNINDNHIEAISANSFSARMDRFTEIHANDNAINFIDPAFFNLSTTLNVVEFERNLCINQKFDSFMINRDNNLDQFSSCFQNFNDNDRINGPATLTCTYMEGWMREYFCMLEIDNIHGRDDFTTISGDHVTNYTDSNTVAVYASEARVGTAVNVPSIICEMFGNLTDLWLDGMHVKFIRDKEFSKCLNLQTLYLGFNEITEVSRNAFKENTKLTLLDLGHNKITYINGDTFKTLTNLEHLYLDGNSFTQIDGYAFDFLQTLHTLWFSSCGFSSLDETWFKGMEELRELQLNDNQLTNLPSEIFSSLRSLQVLNLNDNKLTTISADSFSTRMDKFKEIYANDNKINFVDPQFFNISRTLEIVEFERNECVDQKFEEFTKNRIDNLAKFETCFKNFGVEDDEGGDGAMIKPLVSLMVGLGIVVFKLMW